MLQHEINIFQTLAEQMNALIQSENHYIQNHCFDEAIRLLPEKKRLGREYTKVCSRILENPEFSKMNAEKKIKIKDMARNLQDGIHNNKFMLEMAMQYTDQMIQVFVQSHQDIQKKNIYTSLGQINVEKGFGINHQA